MTFSSDISIQPSISLSLNDVKKACGGQSYQRGMEYYRGGRVVSWEGEWERDGVYRLVAMVEGRDDYDVDVYIVYNKGRSVSIEGDCDCPMAYNCKHVAAACITFVEQYALVQNRQSPTVNSALPSDISQWLNRLEKSGKAETSLSENPYYPVYILQPSKGYWASLNHYDVDVRLTRFRKDGKGLIKGQVTSARKLAWDSQRGFTDTRIESEDVDAASLLAASEDSYYHANTFSGRTGFHLLERLLCTGRFYWCDHEGEALQRGPKQHLEVGWQQKKNSYHLTLAPDVIIFPTEPPMYLDAERHQVGELDIGQWTVEQIGLLKLAPPVPDKQAEQLSHALESHYSKLPMAQPIPVDTEEQRHPLIPCVTIVKEHFGGRDCHCIRLMFGYGDNAISPLPVRAYNLKTQQQKRIKVIRDHEAEESTLNRLIELGFDLPSPQQENAPLALLPFAESQAASAAVWDHFLQTHKPALEAEGWQITIDDSFQLQFHDSDWSAEINYDEEGSDWFTLRFDLEVEGQPSLPLAPLLAPLLAEEGELPETVLLPLPGQPDHYVRLPSQRLQPFISTLKELFDRAANDDELKLSRYDALALDELSEHIDGAEALRELAAKLKNFNGIQVVAPPKGLQAQLRDYQQQGLNWLQFLREYQLNGILADDMGLGKTVQTLAHLLLEKESGRLTSPALIIAPTSLMGNWRREAQIFAPELNVCVLHGGDRHQYYEILDQFDLVLITYGLVARDSEYLDAVSFHTLVLDEAQVIKNPSAKMSKQVRRLNAQHRLCLSGTPMENHLGELWALFDFLMPGFLGGRKDFTEYYRTPIEKQGDSERNQSLQRRVRPFMLRRTKNDVATELPAKTVIDQRVVLGKAQAELYESIRVSMDKQVREALAQKGLARSHIAILDALLKLRQVCCDPRLVKLKGAKKVKDSAKLQLFLELLDELLAEGRKVLVFSQFTTMLGLIEDAMNEREITYTKLTGQTRKRDEAIEHFRSGDANVFLISLKAGGTGLNLVEADTVIIYDPWWNPAVENQAIDRSHRIGQQKPVFVYRLIAENSVEEKITLLQAKKRALAEGVYSDDVNPEQGLLDAESLQELFAPLS